MMRSRLLLLTVFATAVLSAGRALAGEDCAEWDRAVTTTPAPPQTARAMLIHTRLMRTIPASVDVLVIGDSLSAGVPADLVQDLYPGKAIWNAGVGGDKTQQTLWRLDQLGQKLQPRRVLVILGTNNIGAGDKPCAVSAGIAAVFRKIDELWNSPALTYVEILPRPPESSEGPRREANRLISGFTRPGRTIVDVEAMQSCPECHVPDGLHLSPVGYRRLFDILRSAEHAAR